MTGPAGLVVPCVLMRAGTSRGPFFLREWLPAGDVARDEALIGAIGASDALQLDGLGGGSTLTSKVAIVSPSAEPGCDVDYLFAQVGVGRRSVDTRPNCGNMLAGVAPFAIEQGLVPAADGTTTVRVFNVNTRTRVDATVHTPGGRVTYAGDARIDGVAGTAAPIRLDFLDAWGSVTGAVFPTGRRVDVLDGTAVTCIDAAMPLVLVRAGDLGVSGHETPPELDANKALLQRLESLRLAAGRLMGLGDVAGTVVPKPVLVSAGDGPASVTSRYFTPHRCHTAHAVTGAVGVATALALPGTVASQPGLPTGRHTVAVLHPQGRIEVEVELAGSGDDVTVRRAGLVRTARKIMQGELHLPGHVFSGAGSRPAAGSRPDADPAFPTRALTIVVPTSAGGANDTIARTIARRLGPLLGRGVSVDNRAGAHGSIACEYVARAAPDGHTLLLGYAATHAMNPALQRLGYDPVADFAPVGLIGHSPTVLVVAGDSPVRDIGDLLARLRAEPGRYRYASAGDGTVPHLAAELFARSAGVDLSRVTYTGSSPAIGDLAGGRTELMFASLFTAYPWLKTGRLRAMAVAGRSRIAALPEVPTLHEAGGGDVDVTQWYALFAPAGTPAPMVATLNAALNRALTDATGVTVEPGSPDSLRVLVIDELDKWRRIIDRANLTRNRCPPRTPARSTYTESAEPSTAPATSGRPSKAQD
jgi:2-methylaconitate cis-trans-isomerase PrpF/tripartite-type tricarboxylate transporter receptor subunit TctC